MPDNSASARLRPLRVSMFLQGLCLWVPVEKLFMTDIGFDATMFGVMAAAYAAVVPVMEVPSGVLADRWSRRGVLMIATLALLVSVTVGAVSQNVAMYLVSAMILGVYFAMQSGTVEAIVYDTLIETTGGSAGFERQLGRVQLLNSAALTFGSLAGGVLAGLTEPRVAYVASLPAYVLAALALLRLREPTLHRTGESSTFVGQVATTFRTVARQRRLVPVIVVMALGATVLSMLLEFGPLWLVAFGTSTVVFGPYTAAITATLGIGGGLAGRVRFEDPRHLTGALAVLVGGSLTLTLSPSTILVIVAQVVMAALLVTIGIYLAKVLHDDIGSTVRAGVASGVSTMSWVLFLPCALAFGELTDRFGMAAGGWIVTALTVVAGALLVRVAQRRRDAEQRAGQLLAVA